MKMTDTKFPIKTKSSAISSTFGTSVVIYTIIIVVIGPVLGNVITYVVDCSGKHVILQI